MFLGPQVVVGILCWGVREEVDRGNKGFRNEVVNFDTCPDFLIFVMITVVKFL